MAKEQDNGRASDMEDWVRRNVEALRPKLLDLTKKNPLISTRFSPRSTSYIRVVDELPDVLAFELGNQHSMRFAPLPPLESDPLDEKSRTFQGALTESLRTDETYLAALEAVDRDNNDAADLMRRLQRELKDRVRIELGMPRRQSGSDVSLAQHAKLHNISPAYDLPLPDDEHEDGRHTDEVIQTLFLPDDLERKMTAVSTKCRTWLQETGINVLHAAFGFLEWQDDSSRTPALAPLVLMPVEVTKKKTHAGPEFWVKGRGESIETNFVLAEMLRSQYAIDLPLFEGGSVEEYLTTVGEIEPINLKWKVRRQVAFGVFPSARMAMYHDLDTAKNPVHQNELVQQLLGGKEAGSDSPFADEYDVDSPEIEKKIPCLVMDADSSQMSVVADISDGRSLAVEGPPGTGKSQTIVNTIAAAIAAGKKVLFVAEKMAALEVVRSRLESVGLGEFVLPLQAERSTREQVISSVRSRLVMDTPKAPSDYDRKIQQFKSIRAELSEYVDLIGSPFGSSGLNIYEVLGKAMWSNDLLVGLPEIFSRPPILDPDTFDKSAVEELREAGEQLNGFSQAASEAPDHWRGLDIESTDRFTLDQVVSACEIAAGAYSEATRVRAKLPAYGLDKQILLDDLAQVRDVLESFKDKAQPGDLEIVESLCKNDLTDQMGEFVRACEKFDFLYEGLVKFIRSVEDQTLPSLLQELGELARDCGLETLDLSTVDERLQAYTKTLSTLRSIDVAAGELKHELNNLEDLSIRSLRAAYSLIQETGRDVLALRTQSNNNPDAAAAIVQAARRGQKLLNKRSELLEHASIPAEISGTDLAAHAAILRDAGFFSFLSPSFRKSKQLAQALIKASKPANDAAARCLQEVAEWKDAETQFLANDQTKACFGLHFRGVDTDFDAFEKLCTFYERIDTELSGSTNRALRKFLREAELDGLLSFPQFSPNEFGGSVKQVQEEIKRLEAASDQLSASKSKLATAQEILLHPSETSVRELATVERQLREYHELGSQILSNNDLRGALGPKFKGPDTEREASERWLELAELVEGCASFKDKILDLMSGNTIADALAAFTEVMEADEAAESTLSELSDRSGLSTDHFSHFGGHEVTAAYLHDALADREGLQAHAAYLRARRRVNDLGFSWATEALFGQEKKLRDFGRILEASIIRAMALQLMKEHGSVLDRFPGSQLDELRKRLARLDQEIIKLSRRQLRADISASANPPHGSGTGPKAKWTEMSLLKHEAGKQKRHISVRDLTKRAGRSLQALKPCWMMSPLSVAQYLDAQDLTFDICIIDEASQMRPEDAIGAIARCQQTMVVGDTNQLPPSNFFQKMLSDGNDGGEDDDDGPLVDEESILEIANSKLRPGRRLKWHYRSEHSGLIRFSNELVYDGDLVIFPSSSEARTDMGVSLVPVAGAYKSGVNPIEAREIVQAALQFMRSSPDRSLGIVTLNQKQRDLLIEEMGFAIDQDKAATEYVERWRTENGGLEYFFIKNLENVQGDERDVIFIGTVYGPEQPGGPVMQRFGPINGRAGRRRLNVLFSRAKKQIVTFSSMKPSDITSDEHTNPGTYMLKRWLDYSASGILEATDQAYAATDSDFEDYVIAQLKSMGCEPVPQVGASGYFIDIGVKHPDWPYGYILGVECDGAAYHSCRSARDRDRLRQQVLERLGWKFHRIWSTDWFNDPQEEAKRLREAIESRLRELKEAEHHYRPVPANASPIDIGDEDVVSGDESAFALTPNEPDETSSQQSFSLEESLPSSTLVSVGDRVRVRYLTGQQATIQVTITEGKTDLENGLIGSHEPLADALLGAEEGEEIEVLVGSYVRKAVVEQVSPSANQNVATSEGSRTQHG